MYKRQEIRLVNFRKSLRMVKYLASNQGLIKRVVSRGRRSVTEVSVSQEEVSVVKLMVTVIKKVSAFLALLKIERSSLKENYRI